MTFQERITADPGLGMDISSFLVMVLDASTNPSQPKCILEANVKYDEQINAITLLKRVSSITD